MTKTAVSEWSRDYELWKGHLKRVEGTQKGPLIIGNHIWMLLLLCFIEILKKKKHHHQAVFGHYCLILITCPILDTSIPF